MSALNDPMLLVIEQAFPALNDPMLLTVEFNPAGGGWICFVF